MRSVVERHVVMRSVVDRNVVMRSVVDRNVVMRSVVDRNVVMWCMRVHTGNGHSKHKALSDWLSQCFPKLFC
jgi:hypothetical protein